MKYITPILFALLFFSACNKIQQPEFLGLQNFVIDNVSGNQIRLTAEVLMRNPNKIKATLSAIDIDILYKEKKIGVINESLKVQIPANSEFSVPIQAYVDASFLKTNLLGSLLDIVNSRSITLNLDGTTTIKFIQIPVKVKIEHTETLMLSDFLN